MRLRTLKAEGLQVSLPEWKPIMVFCLLPLFFWRSVRVKQIASEESIHCYKIICSPFMVKDFARITKFMIDAHIKC